MRSTLLPLIKSGSKFIRKSLIVGCPPETVVEPNPIPFMTCPILGLFLKIKKITIAAMNNPITIICIYKGIARIRYERLFKGHCSQRVYLSIYVGTGCTTKEYERTKY